jgi:hypothetical protein
MISWRSESGGSNGSAHRLLCESRVFPSEPVVTTLVCFASFRTRGCGCSGHPAFPAPSVFSRVVRTTTRAYRAARMRRHALSLSLSLCCLTIESETQRSDGHLRLRRSPQPLYASERLKADDSVFRVASCDREGLEYWMCPGAWRRPGGGGHDSIIYFATNSAWVISDLLSASSSSRNFSMSLPVRKTGFSACFSM